MGTRHLICVKKDNEYKIAQYGQWDGYLDGQGKKILSFLKDKKNIEKLKNNLNKIRFIDDVKDKDLIEAYDKNAPQWSNAPDKRTKEQLHWFETYMTRDLSSDILINIADSSDDSILLRNEIAFAGDSLFCEYAYVIDLDKNTFEIFKGFNKNPLDENDRFYAYKQDGEYHPIKLLKTYDLNKLPTEKQLLKLDKDAE